MSDQGQGMGAWSLVLLLHLLLLFSTSSVIRILKVQSYYLQFYFSVTRTDTIHLRPLHNLQYFCRLFWLWNSKLVHNISIPCKVFKFLSNAMQFRPSCGQCKLQCRNRVMKIETLWTSVSRPLTATEAAEAPRPSALSAPVPAVPYITNYYLTKTIVIYASIRHHSYHRLSLVINNAFQINFSARFFKDFRKWWIAAGREKTPGKEDDIILFLRSFATFQNRICVINIQA